MHPLNRLIVLSSVQLQLASFSTPSLTKISCLPPTASASLLLMCVSHPMGWREQLSDRLKFIQSNPVLLPALDEGFNPCTVLFFLPCGACTDRVVTKRETPCGRAGGVYYLSVLGAALQFICAYCKQDGATLIQLLNS